MAPQWYQEPEAEDQEDPGALNDGPRGACPVLGSNNDADPGHGQALFC